MKLASVTSSSTSIIPTGVSPDNALDVSPRSADDPNTSMAIAVLLAGINTPLVVVLACLGSGTLLLGGFMLVWYLRRARIPLCTYC